VSAYALGIDLGGSSVKAVSITPGGEILARQNVEFALEEAMDWASKIRDLVNALQRAQGAAADWIGLSAPGLASRDARSIAFMPGRLQELEGLNWTEYLQCAHPIPVLNDAHAALKGEAWRGAAVGCQNVFMLTLGTGVGGAAIVDGRLLRGHLGRAGHLGHICLDPHGRPDITGLPGSLEDLVGNCSIQELSQGAFKTTHELIAAHLSGNAEATRTWMASVVALACGIASLINVLDPEMVVLGGGIARAGGALFDPLQDELQRIEWRPGGGKVRVVAAKLGEFAGAIGAARESQVSAPS